MLMTAFQNFICSVSIELSVMVCYQIFYLIMANLGQTKNWRVSFVVEYILLKQRC